MNTSRVLVVDDEVGMLEVCRDTLKRMSDVVVEVESDAVRAERRLGEEPWDLLITDIRMPQLGGLELIRRARERDINVMTLLITAFPSMETAIHALKLGVADYIIKPFPPEMLLCTVQRLINTIRLRQENQLLRRQVERPYSSTEIVGRTEAIQHVLDVIERIAAVDDAVLITGETGTGKELVARRIHEQSCRARERFVPVDCGAIPEDLLESEFFGHERGAFTGATARSLGLLEFAHRGTFFLDEISELPLRLQAKLLRALQEQRIRRVGGREEVGVDVRIIAASNLDLEEEVRAKRFRTDLYFRLNVLRVSLPPLRERSCDVPLLVDHFIQRCARDMGRDPVKVDPEVTEVLTGYGWPGNVRELQNVLRRMLALSGDAVLRVADLPDEVVAGSGLQRGRIRQGLVELREQRINMFERDYLLALLERHGGDVPKAALEARVPRATMYRLLSKHELVPAVFR